MEHRKWKNSRNKKWTAAALGLVFLCICIILPFGSVYAEEADPLSETIQSPCAILMEAQTGTVLYEKEQDARRSPASITKIMTLLLIFEELEKGNMKLDDLVTTSGYAKSMGGSQVYLEEGEQQSVETLIKCIVIASGNDASVAMAEQIAGSEEAFVQKMNEKAETLGMTGTHFTDCCGLTDSSEHYTTAGDVAVMSRELITRFPEIFTYSTIWMEEITHVTRQGSKPFGLTNTNKMLRSYEGCKGLKTGSTSKAGFCYSGVAERNGITLIAVIMGAPDPKGRFRDAAALLNYGFSVCSYYEDTDPEPLPLLEVVHGKEETVSLRYKETFRYLTCDGTVIRDVTSRLELPQKVEAPVKKDDTAGELCYYMEGKEIGRIPVIYEKTIARAGYLDCLKKLWRLQLDVI